MGQNLRTPGFVAGMGSGWCTPLPLDCLQDWSGLPTTAVDTMSNRCLVGFTKVGLIQNKCVRCLLENNVDEWIEKLA